MKIKIEHKNKQEKELLDITSTKQKILKDVFFEEDLQSEVERLVTWILEHQIEQQMVKIRNTWLPKLKELGVKSIPTDDEEFAELVFSRPEYQSRSQRDKKFPDKINSVKDLPPGQ